jgi:hypothetical protein
LATTARNLDLSPEVVTRRYLQAYNERPKRSEPLVELARFHRLRNEHAWVGNFQECTKVRGQLLKSGTLPASQVERVAENLTLARRKLPPALGIGEQRRDEQHPGTHRAA